MPLEERVFLHFNEEIRKVFFFSFELTLTKKREKKKKWTATREKRKLLKSLSEFFLLSEEATQVKSLVKWFWQPTVQGESYR